MIDLVFVKKNLRFVSVTMISFLVYSSFLSASDIVDPLNYKGKNICLAISKPDLKKKNYYEIPDPEIESRSKLNLQSARHIISINNVGRVTIDENLTDEKACSGLPFDKFKWHDDGLASDAAFCLTSFNDKKKILIKIKAEASINMLRETKTMVPALASCHFNNRPVKYYSDEPFSVGDVAELGQYIVANDR